LLPQGRGGGDPASAVFWQFAAPWLGATVAVNALLGLAAAQLFKLHPQAATKGLIVFQVSVATW
jgi:hypothetical protein